MPIYEYQCRSCGHELEKLQRMSDEPLKDCPDCGKDQLQRLVSAAGFRLKGSGWYETDFKKGSKKNLYAGDAKSSKPSTSGSSDSKSASTKSESKTSTAKTGTA